MKTNLWSQTTLQDQPHPTYHYCNIYILSQVITNIIGSAFWKWQRALTQAITPHR